MQRRLAVSCWKLCSVCFFMSYMILFGATVGHTEIVRGVDDTTIKIGLLCDLTGPSAGDIGLPIFDGVTAYTRYVNDTGGIFGRKVKLIVEDDRYSIPTAIAGFKKLLFKDKMFLFIGPGNSGAAKALCPQMEKRKVITMGYAPDEFMVVPLKKHVFLPLPLYDDQLGVIYNYIVNDLKPETLNITFVSPDTELGKVGLASTEKWAQHFNFSFKREIINMGALDATSQVLNIRRKKATHVIVHHTSGGAAALLRDLKKFGLNIPVYGTLPTCTEDTVRMAGAASSNYTGVHSFGSWYDNSEGVKEMRDITLKYKPGTETPIRSKIYTGAWVVSTVIYEGLNRVGKDLTTDAMIQAWENIRGLDMKGLCGPFTFTSKDHKGLCYSKLYKANPENIRFAPVTEWRKPVGD